MIGVIIDLFDTAPGCIELDVMADVVAEYANYSKDHR
jgi:hypothetical protein